jgi:holo-[acyl-carrier protein] synthase
MILGIGIDIVHISRMKKWQAEEELLRRYFHPLELEDAQSRGPRAVQSLAARFAAKEAYGKALGTGMRDLKLKDIRVRNDGNGKPDLELYGTAKERFKDIGGKSVFVSMTHERDNAIAVVVLEA